MTIILKLAFIEVKVMHGLSRQTRTITITYCAVRHHQRITEANYSITTILSLILL